MHIYLDMIKNLYYKTLQTLYYITSDEKVKRIINSINDNQIESKMWLVEKLKEHLDMFPDSPKICVAAGWYGLTAHLMRNYTDNKIVSFDIDPECEKIGNLLYDNIQFKTEDINQFNPKEFDIIICTSCEHITDEELNKFLDKRKSDSLVVLHSNNYYQIGEHTNCKDSLQHFEKSVNLNILNSYEKRIENKFDRYMIIGA